MRQKFPVNTVLPGLEQKTHLIPPTRFLSGVAHQVAQVRVGGPIIAAAATPLGQIIGDDIQSK